MGRIKSYLIVIVVLFFFICFGTTALACWGGRPLAMGGAFVGVADGPDAVYWNPAGLALKNVGLNTSLVTNWHDLNYDMYFSLVPPTEERSFGVAYVYNRDYLARLIITDYWGEKDVGWICQSWHYLQLAYGRYIVEEWNLAIGVAGKFIYSKFLIDPKGDAYKDETISRDSTYDLDLGVYWAGGPNRGEHKMFSLGCLFQDVFESKLKFKRANHQVDDENGEDEDGTITQQFLMNIRPGLGFRPDENTLLSLEIYDAGSAVYEEPQIRVGAERWFGSYDEIRYVLRVGAYHLNNKGYDQAYTGGVGLKIGGVVEISYTIMHWVKDNKNSHLVTLNMVPEEWFYF